MPNSPLMSKSLIKQLTRIVATGRIANVRKPHPC